MDYFLGDIIFVAEKIGWGLFMVGKYNKHSFVYVLVIVGIVYVEMVCPF